MLHTVEALLNQPIDEALSGAVLSEQSLATDWLREEEDAAWAHLQSADSANAQVRR